MQLDITKADLTEILREADKHPEVGINTTLNIYKTPHGEIYVYADTREIARFRSRELPDHTQLEPSFY